MLALCFLPSIWAKRVIKANAQDRSDFPGTGGELARHLLDTLNMEGVKVEAAPTNEDHFDPADKAVRLSPENLNGRSLSAVTVAAHEVGHAIQDRDDDRALANRTRLVRISAVTERIGIAAMIISGNTAQWKEISSPAITKRDAPLRATPSSSLRIIRGRVEAVC